MDLGFGVAGRRKRSLAPPLLCSPPKTTTPISHPTIKMTSPVSHSLTILLSQVISMNGLVSIGPLGVNVFCFLGNVYKGISLQANSVRSTLDLFSFHSTTERDEKSKHGESEWRSHKSRLDGPRWPFMVTSVHPISFFRGPTSPFSPFTSV